MIFPKEKLCQTAQLYKKQITYYNASNGAKIEGCIPRHLSEIDFTILKTPDHLQFRKFIEHEKLPAVEAQVFIVGNGKTKMFEPFLEISFSFDDDKY